MHTTEICPKGVLRPDHLLLLDEDLYELSISDLRNLMVDVIESLQLISGNDSDISSQMNTIDFLNRSVEETHQSLQRSMRLTG